MIYCAARSTNSAWTRYSISRGVLGSRCPSRSAKRRKGRGTHALIEVSWAPYSFLITANCHAQQVANEMRVSLVCRDSATVRSGPAKNLVGGSVPPTRMVKSVTLLRCPGLLSGLTHRLLIVDNFAGSTSLPIIGVFARGALGLLTTFVVGCALLRAFVGFVVCRILLMT